MNDGSNLLFDEEKYKQYIETNKDINGKSILEREKDAFMKYINNNAKRLPAGLGCLMKVVQTFSKDSYEDNELVKSIYKNIDSIINYQANITQCESDFFNTLFDIGYNKRVILFGIPYNDIITTTNSDSKVLRDKEGYMKGIKYLTSEDEIGRASCRERV